MTLINLGTAWWHYRKDASLWSTDRADRFWALESWLTRTPRIAWFSFFLAITLFFPPLDNLSVLVKDIGLVPHEAHIARENDTQALFACETIALLSLLLDHTHQFHVYFRGIASQIWIYYSGLVYSLACLLLTITWFVQSAGKWEQEGDKSKVGNSSHNVLLLCRTFVQMCSFFFGSLCRVRNCRTSCYVHSDWTFRISWCMQGDLSCWLLREFPVKLLQTSPIQLQDAFEFAKRYSIFAFLVCHHVFLLAKCLSRIDDLLDTMILRRARWRDWNVFKGGCLWKITKAETQRPVRTCQEMGNR
jgi:hypothetical protein